MFIEAHFVVRVDEAFGPTPETKLSFGTARVDVEQTSRLSDAYSAGASIINYKSPTGQKTLNFSIIQLLFVYFVLNQLQIPVHDRGECSFYPHDFIIGKLCKLLAFAL